jgi:hypothetical protein
MVTLFGPQIEQRTINVGSHTADFDVVPMNLSAP